MLAFKDIHPKAPVHVLIVTKKHIESLRSVSETDKELLGKLMLAVKTTAEKLGIADGGYKVIANNGKDSGQLVLHLHFHVLGGWKRNPEWEI